MIENENPMDYKRFSGMNAADLLFHEKPMVLLDTIVSVSPHSATCLCNCEKLNPFYLPGVGIPSWVAIEFMAQCVAVNAGVRARIAGKPLPLGLLLGTMFLDLPEGYFQPGRDCRVESSTILSDDQGMGAHQCSILVDGRLAAQARLTAKEIDRGNESIGTSGI